MDREDYLQRRAARALGAAVLMLCVVALAAPAGAAAEKVVYVYNQNAAAEGGYDPNSGFSNHIRVDEPNGSAPYPIVSIVVHNGTPEEQPDCPCAFSDPAISPDGARIAVAVNESGNTAIWVMDVDGSFARRIVDAGDSGDSLDAPVWETTGSRIYLRRTEAATGNALIESYSINGSDRQTIVSPGQTISAGPVISPTGALLTYSTHDGMFVASLDGSGSRRIVSRVAVTTLDDPCGLDQATLRPEPCLPMDMAFSPSGERLAFDAGGQIFTVSVDGGDAEQVTCSDQPSADPSWSGDGQTIAFQQYYATSYAGLGVIRRITPNGRGHRLMIPDDGDTTYADISFQQRAAPGLDPEFTSAHCPNFRELLPRYGPELRYDPQESFYAGKASMMTDNFDGDVSNKLVTGAGEELAWADGRAALFPLSLGALDDKYPFPSRRVASADDWLDADNGDYAADAGRMHASGYGDHVYARGIRDQNGDSWLQYWFYYYYNPFGVAGIGPHEGDWEGIQIKLAPGDTPATVVYAQHKQGESCTWDAVAKAETPEGLVPAVYVGLGSHASYHDSGKHATEVPNTFDTTSEEGPDTVPAVEIIRSDSPGWVRWPGHWGHSDSDGLFHQASPRTPSFQGGRWDDPARFAADAVDCRYAIPDVLPPGLPKAQQGSHPHVLPTPSVRARRERHAFVVSYRFADRVAKRDLQRLRLYVSVDSAADRRPPYSREYAVRSRRGRLRIRPPRVGGRAAVLASARDKRGNRSRLVRVITRR